MLEEQKLMKNMTNENNVVLSPSEKLLYITNCLTFDECYIVKRCTELVLKSFSGIVLCVYMYIHTHTHIIKIK